MSRIEKVITGRDTTRPLTPSTLQVVGVTASSVSLTCAASSDVVVPGEATTGVVSYRWYVSLDGSAFTLAGATSVPSFTHMGLAAATRYYYRVSAVDFVGLESDLSAVASGLTDDGIVPNRAPVWSSAALTINVYPGDTVSRQLVAGTVANAAGVDVWDVDGDDLEFSEVATGVLSLLGLSVSSTGLIAGTIPAEAEPQTLTFQVSASDGQLSATKSGTVRVYEVTDAVADWEARSQGPDVFWACNGVEWLRGMPDYTSQPTKDYPAGQPGRLIDPIADISQLPHNEAATLPSSRYLGDIGDGAGQMKFVEVPGVAGKLVMSRMSTVEAYTYSDGEMGTWSILPWAWVPLDYVDAEQGTGEPNKRRGINGTIGEGAIYNFVDTADSGRVSAYNPSKRPMVRQFWMQFLQMVPAEHYGYRNRLFNPDYVAGVAPADWDNKTVFVTGGQSTDQFAFKLDSNCILSAMGYRGTSTGGVSMALTINVLGRGNDPDLHHSGLRLPGWDALTSSQPAEDWMAKRGPAVKAMVRGLGLYPDGVTQFVPDYTWYDPESAEAISRGYTEANSLTNPSRNYPYGGFNADGTVPFPTMGWEPGATAGVFRANVPMVIELFFSDQTESPVDLDDQIADVGVNFPVGPRLVAVWAAPYGEAPQLLMWSGSNGRNGPGLRPSRAFHRAGGENGETIGADVAMLFKYQENAIYEGRGNCGWMVVGALDGFDEPTSTVFYALRANPEGDLLTQYVGARGNKAVDPGTVHNFGAGLGMGFAKGELSGVDYRPAQPGKPWQYRILRTAYTGQNITVPNAYRTDLAMVFAPVHRFEFASPLAAVPRARSADYIGDCFNVLWLSEDQRPLGRQIAHGQVIYSMKQIPFPGHLDTRLEWPADWA